MRQLMLGVNAMGCLTVALFFLRFFRQTRDALFGFFSAAFALLAVNAVLLGLADPTQELRGALFLPRLIAFVLIIVGIIQKNRAAS